MIDPDRSMEPEEEAGPVAGDKIAEEKLAERDTAEDEGNRHPGASPFGLHDASEDNEADDVEEADEVTSLDALAAAYAGLVGGDRAAAQTPKSTNSNPRPEIDIDEETTTAVDAATIPKDEPDAGEADEPVSPVGILEAVLFVGNAENTPLTAKRIAALMRGVSPREIDKLVVELNGHYEALGAPYEVVSQGAGYALSIRDDYAGLRDRFYGSVREARLSQPAIDILAVIAYGQPLTREEIDETRGKPSGGILSQLVRRRLLRIERPTEKPRRPKYYTTQRFLKIMGLEDISELPESQEFDKTF